MYLSSQVRDFHACIGKEARRQCMDKWGGKPDILLACVGGGSNAIGLFHEFVNDEDIRLIGVEAAGFGTDTNKHAATLTMVRSQTARRRRRRGPWCLLARGRRSLGSTRSRSHTQQRMASQCTTTLHHACATQLPCVWHAAMTKLRIGRVGFGTRRQKMALERCTNPKLTRRTCRCEYGLQLCRGKSAGVAKRPRVSDVPPEISNAAALVRWQHPSYLTRG